MKKNCTLFIIMTTLFASTFLNAQVINTHASGFDSPSGLEVDENGMVWLTATGTSNDDGKVIVIGPNGEKTDVITGLPSLFNADTGEIIGSWRTHFLPDNRLLVVSGEGEHELAGTMLVYDLTDFNLGDTPITLENYESAFNVDDYILGMGFMNSNPYSVAFNDADEMFIVDAGANAVLKRDSETDALSIYQEFEAISNPTPVGPPMMDAVPTKIITNNKNGFYVGTLRGFPFLEGSATIYEIDENGTLSEYATDLTMVVDLNYDPTDGELVALQFAEFGTMGFNPNSAKIIKLKADGTREIMAEGFGPAAGFAFDAAGDIYVTSIFTGEVLKIELNPSNIFEAAPTSEFQLNVVPNPVLSSTQIQFEIKEKAPVSLKLYNTFGQHLSTIFEGEQNIGQHRVTWNRNDLPAGIYWLNLQVNGLMQTKKMVIR